MDVRKDFPILKRRVNGKPLVYLDNAATSQKPKQVIDAVRDFYEKRNANLGRGVHTLGVEATEMYEDARREVASFINAEPEEIVFTLNSTQGLNMAAGYCCRDLDGHDELLTTIMEHHSCYLPVAMACEKSGARLRIADITGKGRLDMDDYAKKMDGKTRAVAAAHVSNVLGTVNPAKEMARLAHESGALFILDAAQSAAHMRVDVQKLDCDFMAFSGHKMLGPTGTGVLYGRKELLEDMEPPLTGGGMVSRVRPEGTEFLGTPRKFEAGTQNIAGVVGLGAAVDYLKKLGMGRVQKHEKKLTKRALRGLGGMEGVELYGPEDRAGIISFNVEGMDPHEVAAIMDESGIAVRSGHHCAQPLMRSLGIDGCARMSFYVYNTQEEADYALGVIEKIGSLA